MPQNKGKINLLHPLDSEFSNVVSCQPMANKSRHPRAVQLRVNGDDWKLIESLRGELAKKLPGSKIDNCQVLRFALRCAADLELQEKTA